MPDAQWLSSQSEIIRHDPILTRMMELVAKRNIPVALARLSSRVNGMAHASLDAPFILLSDRMSADEMRFIFGHEIGHIMLHAKTDSIYLKTDEQSWDKEERKADRFSLRLLKLLDQEASNNHPKKRKRKSIGIRMGDNLGFIGKIILTDGRVLENINPSPSVVPTEKQLADVLCAADIVSKFRINTTSTVLAGEDAI